MKFSQSPLLNELLPAWRSRLWMAGHPWFEADVLPDLKERVRALRGR